MIAQYDRVEYFFVCWIVECTVNVNHLHIYIYIYIYIYIIYIYIYIYIYRWVPLKPDFLGAWKSVRLKHYPAYPIIIISLIIQRNLATKIRAKREFGLTTVWLKRDPPVYILYVCVSVCVTYLWYVDIWICIPSIPSKYARETIPIS